MVEGQFVTRTEYIVEKFESLDQVAARAKTILGLVFHRAIQHSGVRKKKEKDKKTY